MDSQISDLKQRKLALDPTQSFIVQAPAGSGKTGLLVQRYLTLLAIVNAPEEIVAITFTRKAACQMRNRIIDVLKNASSNIPSNIQSKDQYEIATQKLALAALKQNQNKAWDIIKNPKRLRIQTIDSFCNYLARCAPILAKSSVNPKIIQNQEAETYYRGIARSILENHTDPEYKHYLETLFLHLDNDWKRAENLFITMLKLREQWLPHIIGLKNTGDLRKRMELALKTISEENRQRCLMLFPKELQQEFLELIEFSNSQKITIEESFHSINFAAKFLLTQEFSWRKKITKEHGFPSQASGRNKQEKELFKLMKKRMEDLLIKFSEHENFRMSLENLLCSPPPTYSDQQWEMIAALLKLLPLLVAELKVVFNEQNITDYAEIGAAAGQALGDCDQPSELALNLDYSLQHLLVDEFQDTSIAQYRLLEKLISNWQPGDGHTLFVVGDPMQSIYRFREAEVGLFLRAQNENTGMLKLHSLTLTTNFRASQNIIDWINTNFSKIFPIIADISFGAIPFKPSTAIKQAQNSQVTIELLKNANANDEAAHIIEIIQKLNKQDPEGSLAILVRARSHLQEIITGLRKANLAYQAHELESLGSNIVVRDLFALTRALFHPADRIAWLAILRAPWCGLGLNDLHEIASGSFGLIWDNICNYHELKLSTNGILLTQNFKTILDPIFAKRGRILWRELIEEAWFKLGGPRVATCEVELEYADIYLKLLETDSLDIEMIQKKCYELYAPSKQTANIQLMTIHKAKGLEFDHVIIPRVDRATRFEERKLMLWFERPKMHSGSDLLLSPIEASGNEVDAVYQYLQLVEQKKNFYETGRLLYVALTRAKKTVHMTGLFSEAQTDSLLKQLKPCFNENWIITKI